MAPLSLKIVQGGGAITRTVLFDSTMRVSDAHEIVKEKVLLDNPGKEYGLFLTSADDELSGVWLEGHRTLDYYMLRDGDSLQYLCRTRNLRVRMLDGSEKTMQIDESKCVSELMMFICDKIGITNHEEYGLCFEDITDPQKENPAIGTLTLRKQQTREKDLKLEQLSKKLKTDDNVEWLDQHKTLRQLGVDPKETLLLKRRLFYSDRNVDSRDPVQLNLLYVQTRDAILDGRQVVTENKAVEFAGIQCQVQYGDYQEDKHKPGFIENLKEFLPEQYANSWGGVEKKVLKEHSKHQGLSPLEAKHLYTKTARELPTYGVTFFLVKEQQKGKKKLVPRLLGINAESILRLDEVTKEILQVWMLTQVKTFRAGKETFTLDFGDYSDKEYTVKTNEAHRIRDILQGYIDIIHRSLAAPFNVTPVEGHTIYEDNVQSSKGQIIQNIVPKKVVEHSYVGPSKLISYIQGSEATIGTQIMTVKQMLVTKKGSVQHREIVGSTGVGSSMEYLKKLKRLNSNSMETVEFLTDPNNKQEEKVQKVNALVANIEGDMNSIIEGVHKSVDKDNDEVKRKLLSELDDLCASFKALVSTSKQNDFGTPESLSIAQETAEKIVGVCTQMYCSLDPEIRKRSKILRRSHQSFIADERIEAKLRRASFLAAAAHACNTVDTAKKELDTTFEGSIPEGHEVDKLEREARKKIGKISAAIALLMSAQADPNNLDYSAAITSMTTIDELLPELIQDAKALGSVRDEKSRLSLLSKIKALCDAARNICSLTDDEDKEHMQELAYKYAKASDKLIFIFGRGTVADKENERSHQSFIADERIEAKLRRASFLAAAAHACNTVDTAKKELDTTFEGSIPEGHEVDKLEREARKKIGKISAAIALLMSAQADPNNLDYSAAITSMTTIDELLPELIQDAKALGSVRDEKSRLSLLSKIKALCDAARNICSLTDDEDKEHMQELAYKYAKASDKLIFIFGRGTVADKENEILDLAREVGDKTSLLLMKAHELIKLADSDTRAGELDAAGVRCADASQLLLACAQLTASSIDEPHCQSAMTAAIESLSSSAQHLAATWKPLVEEPGHRMFEESLLNHTMDLMKALDKLKEAYANLSVEENVPIDNANKKENDRLKFIATMRSAINNISEAQKDLDKPIITKAEGENIKELKRLMGQRLSFLNASIASLIRATADREHPDYDTAEQAIAIVAELMPELVRDIKIISATKDEKAGRALLNDIRALCEATQDISSASEQGSMQDVNDAASKFARFSSKLCYAFIPRTELKKENMIVDLSKIACEKASQLLTHVNQLVDEVGGDDGQRLDVCGAKLVDVVQALLTAAQITAPSFADPRCQSTMLSAADDVSSLSNELAATWSPLVRGPERQLLQSNLDIGRAELETALKNLRAACKSYDAVSNAAVAVTESKDKEKERLKFVTAMSLTNNKMLNAEKDLQRPIETMDVNNVGALQRNIAQRLAHLNAAIASLVRATTDPDNVDYSTAEQSISTITQLIPDVIQDTKSLSSLKDDKAQRAMLTELKKLFDATRDICKCTEQGNSQAINDMALKFAEATGKLSYVFNPQQKNDIPILSKAAYDKASNMVISVHELGKLVGGKDGSHLDECGIKMVNAAKSLLTTAQILASSIGDANCNTTLISAIDDVSACSQELTSAWSPIKQNIKHKNAVNKLEMERGKLNSTLNELRAACRDINAMEKVSELHKQDMQQHTPLTATRSSIVRNVAANNIDKELLEVKDLSKKVFIKAREMSMNARKLADLVGGTDGLHLDDCGERVADAAQVLYNTATRGNQSTEEVYGKYSLLAAIDAVSASSLELAAAWSPIERNTAHNKIIEELGHEQVELDDALKKMRASTKLMIGVQDETYASDEKTEQWLKYLKTMSDVKCTLEKASRELDKPVTDTEQAVKSSQLQCNMDPCLAQLNAATASLIRATVDQVNPNYNEADKATRKIGELIPDIIHNSNALSVSKDDVTRQNMATALKALCEATTEICLETEFGRIKNAYDPISKFAEASSKLCYVFNPRADMKRENLIVELSKSACDKASVLLSQVYQLAESTGGEEGAELDRNGAKVVDAAQSLLTTAEITASTIEDPHCQATLMSSADDVTSLLRQLADTWSTLLQDPKRKSLKDQLNSERSELESAIEELRTACKDASDVTLKPTKPVKPPPPKRTSLIYVDQKNLQEEKLKLAKSVDEAIKSIAHTENQIREMYNKKSVDTSVEAAQTASQQLERKLVLASVAASHLVFCNDPEKMNYKVADESVKSLSELFQTIVKDARELSNSHNLRAKSILDDTLGLCEATRALCGAAKDDRQKLNEIAVDFANKSAKLLYTIGTGVDPEQEKEVIARARVIGDCASRLTSCGAAGAQLAEDARAQALCVAASNCANAASNLLYITKLVAPSIQYPESQNILLTAADQLSGQVKQFLSSSTPLSSQQEEFNFVKDLEMEGENLERLLSDLKQDVKNENMVKRRKEEILMIEDSPMRQLASEILETYKTYVESSDLPMEERRNHAHDADKLSAAIKELDVANAHCRNSPQDASTLRRLENATQNLQQTLLQCHRGHGKEQSNIVDLMDYVQDVLSNIEMLSKTANETNGEHCKKQLQDIKDECDKMRKHATKLTNPTEPRGEGNLTDDLLLIDDFAQDCGKAVSRVYSYAKTVPDVQSRRQLEIKTHRLTDSVNILRFAVKSALATADSASLDECLHDLTELESRIDNMLQPTKILHTPQFTKEGSSAFAALCCAAASPHSSATTLTPALTTYVTEMRMRTNLNDPQEKHKLEAHLKKLLCLLKTLMMTTSRHTATWQEQDDGEVMTITDQVIQELENYEDVGSDREKQGYNIIDKVDVRRLLLPPTNKHLKGDKNELSKKLHQTSAKLNSLMGTITSSIQTPNTLSKSLHATAGAAIELATLARGLRNPENRLQSNQIEESARDMCFATFNLLKAAEKVSCEPDRPNSRWRLFDACRSLNDSINKLIRATDYRREGDELIRSLQLQQSFLQNLQPTCALNYEECVEALQNQSDVIYKLKSDQEMSHEEGIANLQYISSTVCNTSEYAAQCAYLISICDKYKIMAKDGLLDVTGLQKLIRSIQESCVRIICLGNISQAKDFESELNEKGRQLQDSINESKGKIEDVTVEKEMLEINTRINTDLEEFNKSVHEPNTDMITINTIMLKILDSLAALSVIINHPSIVPNVKELTMDSRSACHDVNNNSRELLNKTISLVKETNHSAAGIKSWATFDASRTSVLQAFDALMNSIRENGRRAGLLQSSQTEEEESEEQKKSYIAMQVDLAKNWLQSPTTNEKAKSTGIEGVNNVIKIANEMTEDLKGLEKDEMRQVIDEVEKLANECSLKYNKEKASLLLERLMELRKMLERVVVTRVVEDFLEDGTPLGDLDLLVDVEKDEAKRKYLLEQKIADLLAQMKRITRTARLVAGTGSAHVQSELTQHTQQVELLAPSLVKATQERINSPQHQEIIDNYKAVMAQYAESMSKVRILCDRSLDPVDFVQAAGETMQRMREEYSEQDDPLKSAHASNIITRLGQRVVDVGLGSRRAQQEPELRRALQRAQLRLQHAAPPTATLAAPLARTPQWTDLTAEILRTTGEVESALSGENIFQKQLDPNQPIFAAALDLHAAVREWSARDNEIVAVAKRMAVLMARLSDYMNHDKKREVIASSKAIVKASSEVAALARKLALECTDVRIRNNLLQICDRIPTISGQLKMLTTIKGSFLGRLGNQEDKEALNMLVDNAQNLMQSFYSSKSSSSTEVNLLVTPSSTEVQEVVSAAASASVKIMSQRARPRIRWVRKNYYA